MRKDSIGGPLVRSGCVRLPTGEPLSLETASEFPQRVLEAFGAHAFGQSGERPRPSLSQLDTSNNSRCWADWTISAMFG